jgi:pyridinium-3,5-biscarboxylic acid mononucleotide sulfurtransferase
VTELPSNLEFKIEKLRSFVADKGRNGAVIAFSGGVDSSTLAALSFHVLREKAVAVIAQSPTYTEDERKEAEQTAKAIGIKLYTIQTDELKNPVFTKNPENRCYYCKKELLLKLKAFGDANGLSAVFEGTNFSDLGDHRPGYKAVQEVNGVYSPWVYAKFTKEEIRRVAKDLGLKVFDKPSLACLASRIPFNQEITLEKLKRIEKAELAIKQVVKVPQIRVRDHDGLARIEVHPAQRVLFCDLAIQDEVVLRLKQLGFKYVTFDLEGYRSGSMLDTLSSENK